MRPIAPLALALLLCLAGCQLARNVAAGGSKYASLARANRESLSNLRAGMTVGEAIAAMETPVKVRDVNNPYTTETVTDRQGASVLVLRYYTETRSTGWRGVRPDELTPLVFRGDKLAGWGQAFYDQEIGAVGAK